MKMLFLTILLLFTSNCLAGWDLQNISDDDQELLYVDFSSIKKTSSGKRVWILTSYPNGKTLLDKNFKSVKDLVEYDCKQEKERYLKSIYTTGSKGEGEILFSDDEMTTWRYLVPESISIGIYNKVCKN